MHTAPPPAPPRYLASPGSACSPVRAQVVLFRKMGEFIVACTGISLAVALTFIAPVVQIFSRADGNGEESPSSSGTAARGALPGNSNHGKSSGVMITSADDWTPTFAVATASCAAGRRTSSTSSLPPALRPQPSDIEVMPVPPTRCDSPSHRHSSAGMPIMPSTQAQALPQV